MTDIYPQCQADSHALLQQPVANMAEMRAAIDRQTAKIARQRDDLTAKDQAIIRLKEEMAGKDAEIAELQRRLNVWAFRAANAKTYLQSDNPTPAHRLCALLELKDAGEGR